MSISSGMGHLVIGNLVKAFTGTTNEVVNVVRQEYGWDTGNFKNGGSWDTRFNRIKQVALQNELLVLTRKRAIWSFICVLNLDSGTLYVFSKDKNLEGVIKKLGRENIHYFQAFVSLNSDPVDMDNQQMSFFSVFPEDYEMRRIREAQKILGEEYPLVNQVIFVVAKEEERKIVGVEAKLFNRYFELIDVQDWSAHVPDDEYGSILVIDEETIDNTENIGIIPKVKLEVKNRKNHFEKEIPSKKQQKKDIKEEGNS